MTGDIWHGTDGTPIACRDKLRVLAENETELKQVLTDAFEDAILMGVDEIQLRARLAAMVATLRSPLA